MPSDQFSIESRTASILFRVDTAHIMHSIFRYHFRDQMSVQLVHIGGCNLTPLTVSLRFHFMENNDCRLFLLATLGFVPSVQFFVVSRIAVVLFSVNIEYAVRIFIPSRCTNQL